MSVFSYVKNSFVVRSVEFLLGNS